MLAIGGGVQHLISPATALEGGLEIGVGSFGTLDVDGDRESIQVSSSNSVRLRVGMVWRP
jgi:hypothetical protein